jgi:hypothetical protein
MITPGLGRDATIVAQLEKVDWDFPRAGTWASALHSLHWFPGNFIPQIPSYLVQCLSAKGDIVFDPFCGSCTTGVEALILGRKAWMSDFSPVSQLISQSKLSLLADSGLRRRLLEVEMPPLLMASTQTNFVITQGTAELQFWFHEDTFEQLLRIWAFLSTKGEDLRPPLEMLFSDTLFACASTRRARTPSGKSRRHHWGWIADNVRPKPPIWHDALKHFSERLHRTKLIVSQLGQCDAHFQMRKEDIRSCSYESSSADLVVTSPPYIGMIDYTTANRLTYFWNGWELAPDRALEIGARSRRNSPSEPSKYLQDMEIAVTEITRVLKPGGLCAIVIGASRKYPPMAPNVIAIFGRHMSLIWGPKGRSATRRRVSDRNGDAPNEYLCVFRKE